MISRIIHSIPNFSITNQNKKTLKKIKSIAMHILINIHIATASYMTASFISSTALSGILLTVSVVASAILMAEFRY